MTFTLTTQVPLAAMVPPEKEIEVAPAVGAKTGEPQPLVVAEGGVATGLHELAIASGCGLEIWQDALPVMPETRLLCEQYGLDPLGLIASGSLLISAAVEATDTIIKALASRGIDASVIGRVVPPEAGVDLLRGDERFPLPAFSRDELARLFGD